MKKIIQKTLGLIGACFALMTLHAQIPPVKKENVQLYYTFVDKDSSFQPAPLHLQYTFTDLQQAIHYVNQLPALLVGAGYPAASIDSVRQSDSALKLQVYLGIQYQLVSFRTNGIEPNILQFIGFAPQSYENKPIQVRQLQSLQQRLLTYYSNHGYPFASVVLDNISILGNQFSVVLRAQKGLLYRIDSLRVIGSLKIAQHFLHRYLFLQPGALYNQQQLESIDKRIQGLPFGTALQPSDLTMLGTGSVLNLYLQTKKASQFNFLVGLMPAANGTSKLQLTGDVNVDIKNIFGTGEQIALRWQQLQPQSPRLSIGYRQPYIFKSAWGTDFSFDLFKKDSNFLYLQAQAGVQYAASARQNGKLFVQWQHTALLPGAVDTQLIKTTKQLPINIDVDAVNMGLQYEWTNTNYAPNPRWGNEFNLQAMVGIKHFKSNATIASIQDPSFNYAQLYDSVGSKNYQCRIRLAAAHYFRTGPFSTFKIGLQAGYYISPSVFRNELFQIGGFKVLRGFDEESIYANRFAVGTAEYRLLLSLNSYLSFFSDGGFATNRFQSFQTNNYFIAAGIGIVFETKLGLLNFSYAAGKRNDIPFNLREASKIHVGYVNYF